MDHKLTKREKFASCKKQIEAYHTCIHNMSSNDLYNDLCDSHLLIIQSCMNEVEKNNNLAKNNFKK